MGCRACTFILQQRSVFNGGYRRQWQIIKKKLISDNTHPPPATPRPVSN